MIFVIFRTWQICSQQKNALKLKQIILKFVNSIIHIEISVQLSVFLSVFNIFYEFIQFARKMKMKMNFKCGQCFCTDTPIKITKMNSIFLNSFELLQTAKLLKRACQIKLAFLFLFKKMHRFFCEVFFQIWAVNLFGMLFRILDK